MPVARGSLPSRYVRSWWRTSPPLRRRRLCGSLDFAGDVERMPDGLTVPQDKAHGKPSLSAPKPAPEHRCQVRGDDAHRAGLLRPSDRR